MKFTSRDKPIELGDDDRTLDLASGLDRRGELRPALQGIGTLAAFDFDVLAGDRVILVLGEPCDGFALCFQTKPLRPWPAVETRM